VQVKGLESAREMPLEWTGRSVVIAVDDSDSSVHCFDYALKHLVKEHDHLRVVHVQPFKEIEGVAPAGVFVAAPVYTAGKVLPESVQVAKKFAKKCQEAGVKNFAEDIILEDGSVGNAICDYIRTIAAKSSDDILLVLGSRELGFFGRAFLGSTSEYCIRHAHCAVTVVKLPSH